MDRIIAALHSCFKLIDEFDIDIGNMKTMLTWLTSFYMTNPLQVKIDYINILILLVSERFVKK